MRSWQHGKTKEWGLLLLALLALLALEVAVVLPAGEFPVVDDWSYARIAKRWAETGQFAYTGWNQMLLWAYLRFFKTGSLPALASATLLSLLAFLLRQPAILLPVGAMLWVVSERGTALADVKPHRLFWIASLGCLTAMGAALIWRFS